MFEKEIEAELCSGECDKNLKNMVEMSLLMVSQSGVPLGEYPHHAWLAEINTILLLVMPIRVI